MNEADKKSMEKYGITKNLEGQFVYKDYRYQNLKDAINYAEKDVNFSVETKPKKGIKIFGILSFFTAFSLFKALTAIDNRGFDVWLGCFVFFLILLLSCFIAFYRIKLIQVICQFSSKLNFNNRVLLSIFIFWWLALFTFIFTFEPYGSYVDDDEIRVLTKITLVPPVFFSAAFLIFRKFLKTSV